MAISPEKLAVQGNYLFHQDNGLNHSTRMVIVRMPSQSPDLNPIEHLWRKCFGVHKHTISNKPNYIMAIQEEWAKN